MAEKVKDLPGQRKLGDDRQYPAGQPVGAREGRSSKPKLSERDRFILTELLAASKACKSQIKKLRGGDPVQPAIVSAASTLAVAYRTEMMALGS